MIHPRFEKRAVMRFLAPSKDTSTNLALGPIPCAFRIHWSRDQGIKGSRDQGIKGSGGSRVPGIKGSGGSRVQGSRDQGFQGSRDRGDQGSRIRREFMIHGFFRVTP